eukprot:g5987.t1
MGENEMRYRRRLLSDSGLAAADIDRILHAEDTKCLLAAKALAFLTREQAVGGGGRRFCVLDAKTQNIIGAAPEWYEATGLTVDDVIEANASSESGISRAVAGPFHCQPAPPELLKFLKKPGDVFVPKKVTKSSINGQKHGPVFFWNRLAGALPNESRAPVVKFPYQWHKKDGCAYTGYTAVSRLFCRNEDGTDVLAYLLELVAYDRETA